MMKSILRIKSTCLWWPRWWPIALFVCLCFWSSVVFGAASVTITNKGVQKKIIKYTFDWAAHTDGTVTDGATGNPSDSIGGYIVGVLFVPDTGGTQPDDLYDVYLRDANDFDWLFGTGANRSQNRSDSGNFQTPLSTDNAYPVLHSTPLYINVSGAGDSKGGVVYLLIQEP